MGHTCVAAKIVDDAKDGAAHIANMSKPADSVRRDFGSQPEGLARIFAHGIVAHHGNIRDIACGSLRALSENRDSASRALSCYRLLVLRERA